MENYIKRWERRIEKLINAEPEDDYIEVKQLDCIFKWLFRNVVPVIALSLIINLIILFSMPVEIAMSRWFWVKDPVSLILAFILVRGFILMRKSFQLRQE